MEDIPALAEISKNATLYDRLVNDISGRTE